MAPVNRIDALRASPPAPPHRDQEDGADDLFALNDFEDEMKRLSAANQELLDEFQPYDDEQSVATIAAASAPADSEQLDLLRLENGELRARVQELEALG